jgi:hypothetical protein
MTEIWQKVTEARLQISTWSETLLHLLDETIHVEVPVTTAYPEGVFSEN